MLLYSLHFVYDLCGTDEELLDWTKCVCIHICHIQQFSQMFNTLLSKVSFELLRSLQKKMTNNKVVSHACSAREMLPNTCATNATDNDQHQQQQSIIVL